MLLFDCLQHFHIFPDGGGLWDQSPLVWHDLRVAFALLAQAIDDEDDHESDDNASGTPNQFPNIEDL